MWFPGINSLNVNYRHVSAGCAILILFSGCLNAPEIERIRFYTVTPDISVERMQGTEWTLGLRPLFASRTYGASMAYLGDNHEVGYLPRDEWAEPPANVVTRAVTDALAATGRFADVGNAADMARPGLLLTGELRVYHENRTKEPHTAEVEVRLELRQAVEPGSLWAETIRETEPMAENTPQDFAKAMNAAVGRLAVQVASSIANVPLPGKASAASGSDGAR